MKGLNNWCKRLALCLAFAMMFTTSAPALMAEAAKTPTMEISTYEDTQVLIMGESYQLQVDNAISFKSSNPTIASVDKNGTVTPKKTGAVTFVATTKNGKKVSKRYYVVNKQKTTAYQTTLDKMLEASNVSKIVLKNRVTESRYVIKAGDYSDKVLYVNAPKSDVRNYGTFDQVTLVDVGATSWREYAKGNSFTITDSAMHFVAATAASVKEMNLTTENQLADIDVRGVVEVINVDSEGSVVTINTTGDLQKVVINEKSTVIINGKADQVIVEVAEGAEGSIITSSVPVTLTAAADATVVLEKGAEASTLEKASEDVALTLTNHTAASLTISAEGSTQTTEVPVDTSSTSGESTETTTVTLAETASADGKTITYTLPTDISNLKSVNMILGTDNVKIKLPIPVALMSTFNLLLKKDEVATEKWMNTTNDVLDVGNGSVYIKGEVGATKQVIFSGLTFTVTVDGNSKVTINRIGSKATFTLGHVSDTKFSISNDKHDTMAELISFEVTY